MGDQCAACCREYTQHLETERAARLDLERRFEQFMREQFVRRSTLTKAIYALQDKTRALIDAERTIELLSTTLAEWQRLAETNPFISLEEALGEIGQTADPLDVARIEDLPPVLLPKEAQAA